MWSSAWVVLVGTAALEEMFRVANTSPSYVPEAAALPNLPSFGETSASICLALPLPFERMGLYGGQSMPLGDVPRSQGDSGAEIGESQPNMSRRTASSAALGLIKASNESRQRLVPARPLRLCLGGSGEDGCSG